MNRKMYSLEPPILYNNVGAIALYGAYINAQDIPKIGNTRRIIAGSFLTDRKRILPRAHLLRPCVAGDTKLVVSNPWAFQVGDTLKLIGLPGATASSEREAISNSITPAVGKIAAIDGTSRKQVTVIAPQNLQPGNLVNLEIQRLPIVYPIVITEIAAIVADLKALIHQYKHTNALSELTVTATDSALVISSHQYDEPFTVFGGVVEGAGSAVGSLNISVPEPVGILELESAIANPYPVGTKIGGILDAPLGIISEDYYLNDSDGEDLNLAISAYNAGSVNALAVPYLDGSIVASMPKLSFMPYVNS